MKQELPANILSSQECTPRREASDTDDGGLCNFCKPRIFDLSKLGWKEKTDAKGKTYLEPETISSDGEVSLKPWKDENAFGPRPKISRRHSLSREEGHMEGISVVSRDIKIEYFNQELLPDGPLLQASDQSRCPLCGLLQDLIPTRSCFDGSTRYDTVQILSITYHFEPHLETDGENPTGGPSLRLQSLSVHYQQVLGSSTTLMMVKAMIVNSPGTRSLFISYPQPTDLL